MRKPQKAAALTASALMLALAFAGCAGGATGESEMGGNQPALQARGEAMEIESEETMTGEELAVLEAYKAMQQAMVDKDVDAMRALTAEGKTFTHMSGKTQTREEFFGEIADGTLNYFAYEVHEPRVTVEGDHATLTGSTTLDAHVYGASGSWTLPTNARFVKQDGRWIQCN